MEENISDEQLASLHDLFIFENQSELEKIGYTTRRKKILSDRKSAYELNPIEGLNEFEDDIYQFESRDVSTQTLPDFYIGE